MKRLKNVDVPTVLGVLLVMVFVVVILLDTTNPSLTRQERKPVPVNTSETIGKCIHAEVTLYRASISDAASMCYASLVADGERALAREYAGYDADYAAWLQ